MRKQQTELRPGGGEGGESAHMQVASLRKRTPSSSKFLGQKPVAGTPSQGWCLTVGSLRMKPALMLAKSGG